MVCLSTPSQEFFNDFCDVIRLFIHEKQVVNSLTKPSSFEGVFILHTIEEKENGLISIVKIEKDEEIVATKEIVIEKNQLDFSDEILLKRTKKHVLKRQLYNVLQGLYGKKLPWGALTGIRPTKFLREIAKEKGLTEAKKIFTNEYYVGEEKVRLAEQIVNVQKPYMENLTERDIDVYIGIPFCVSRCKYCSFISKDINHANKFKDEYIKKLIREIQSFDYIWKNHNLRALYVGGGTPTALEAKELETVLAAIKTCLPKPKEFTVEAGRPDTVTMQKLEIIAKSGAKRISINTQTTKDETLKRIGRNHSKQEFYTAFEMAKGLGCFTINTDLILGLPGESVGDVSNTMQDVLALAPQNITVHTLAIKNSSEFADSDKKGLPNAQTVQEMVEVSQETLNNAGYLPYYLYRQKYMSGNMENVGFALPGKESIYNIDIMEEIVSNLAFGAGGISKRVFAEQNRIERSPNVKDVKNYIERTDEMIARKKELFLK